MELQEFIKNTLVQITNGIIEAQNELKDTGCLINPSGLIVGEKRINEGDLRNVQKIKMNVVLDVSKTSGSKSGIGVAKVIKAGIDSEETNSNTKVTSVEFEIPIAFPLMSSNK